MIKTLLFDLGGTLHTVQHSKEVRRAFCVHLLRMLKEHGIVLNTGPEKLDALLAVNGEAYKHWSEKSLRELPQEEIWADWYLREFGLKPEQLAPFAEQLSFAYDRERVINTPRPRLRQTMERLHAMGIRLGIVSNIISTTLVPFVLKEYGIDGLMECVVMSSSFGIRKPDARIFEEAMRQMGTAAEETGYVGDTVSRDVLGARNAGLGLVVRIDNPLIAHRDAAFQGPDAPKADHVIRELDELLSIMEEMNGYAR